MITNYFQPFDDNYKDTHSDPKWEKINTNEANNLEDININFHQDKVVNIPSHCSTELDFFKLKFIDELFENIAKGNNDYIDFCKKKWENKWRLKKKNILMKILI